MKTLRLPAYVRPFPYGFGPGFHVRLPLFVFAVVALPMRAEVTHQARDAWSAGVPYAGLLRSWTRAGSLRLPGGPSHAFALLLDPGRADKSSPLSGLADAAPGPNKPKAPAGT